MTYRFSETSTRRTMGVHPILVERAERVLSYGVIDLTVLKDGGVRSEGVQRALVDKGASKTMESHHRPQTDGFGHALDIAPYPIDWDNLYRFAIVGSLMFRAASEDEYDVPMVWGGHWRTFKDFPHFQIPREIKQ